MKSENNKINPLAQNYVPQDVENSIVDYWKQNKIFEKSVENRDKKNSFRFYDGPPFVTGLPHYGHLLGSIVKDVIPRYQTMKGKRVERVWGWDCHGLPVENKVEKQLNINSKKEIETLGVDKFVDACRSYVKNVSSEWDWYIDHVGRWVDIKNAYRTMDTNYMESVIWVFKQLYDKNKTYKGNRVSLFCPRCSSPISNFEVAMDNSYKDVTDPSVFIKFPLKDKPNTFLLAWTTTPWTLPTNFALGVSAQTTYAEVVVMEETLILAKDLLPKVFQQEKYQIVNEFLGSNLVGQEYVPLYDYYVPSPNDHKVYSADFVSLEDGTGIVHIAPGFGEDDTKLGKDNNLSQINSVDDNGMLDPVIKVANGKYFKSADKLISANLAERGLMFRQETITHSYPHCYRCETPLLYKAQVAWYIDVQNVKSRLKETNEEINWVPEHFKHGRFELGIDSAPDWCISRSRYWGTPMPIWECNCGERKVFGSIAEIEKASGQKITELHRPEIDLITIDCDKCGQTMHRIPEVLDCWVESASMPYAQGHYPFENEDDFVNSFPADFIVEYTGQLRAWFYVTHVISNLLNDSIAFKNVIVNGIVLAEDGKKMSKRLKNYPDPMEVMEKYGADAVRYYLMSTPAVRAENLRFSEAGVDEVSKKFITILRNVLSFYELYKEHDDGRSPLLENILDSWILSRLNETLEEQTVALNSYELSSGARCLQGFVTDLSTWYVRRSRDRMKSEGEDRQEALATLRVVLETFSKMIAPYMPYLGEVVYQGVKGGFAGSDERLSVHLESWPQSGMVQTDVLEKMGQARSIVSRVLDAREAGGRPIKQALGDMTAWVSTGEIGKQYQTVILDEVNVKAIKVERGDLKVEVNMGLTPELIRDGMARDITRRVNQMRKDAGFTIQDRIDLKIYSESDEVKRMFTEHELSIKDGTLADSIELIKDDSVEHSQESRIAEQDVWIGF